VPSVINVDSADAAAIEQAFDELRAAGDLDGANEQDVRDEMLVALWRRPDVTIPCLKAACAALAARGYLGERAHVAPTAPLPRHREKPRQRTSWWGMLVAEEED
jgi:hypothetical protein